MKKRIKSPSESDAPPNLARGQTDSSPGILGADDDISIWESGVEVRLGFGSWVEVAEDSAAGTLPAWSLNQLNLRIDTKRTGIRQMKPHTQYPLMGLCLAVFSRPLSGQAATV
jgi:hypothetical protein